ncbi:glycosyltransferase family 2 protein [Geotalea uraniireducens]|nr:glycosyltransferase [Geotalea uraniireducens]
MLPLSVVICTFNRAGYLELALKSLLTQTLGRERYEIVIIDDGSTDSTKDVVDIFRYQLPIRYFYQYNSGLAAAKNLGIEKACGDIIFFFDDDDIATPALLEEHLKTHNKYPESSYAVLNYTTWSPELRVTSLMKFITEVGCYLFSYPNVKKGKAIDYTYFWGGRSSCKRSMLVSHGTFNPLFRFGCEDIELGYRLSKHGFKVIYNPKAISYMARSVNLSDFLQRLVKQGSSQYLFSSMYIDPEVDKWCEINGFQEEWLQIEPVYKAAVTSALSLEKIADTKLELGLEVDALTERLFYQSLWSIFRGAKIKGMVNCHSRME